jgi:hypothetical protein
MIKASRKPDQEIDPELQPDGNDGGGEVTGATLPTSPGRPEVAIRVRMLGFPGEQRYACAGH